MEFKLESNLVEAISSDNINGVRNALIEYIIRDSGNTQEIINALNYAKELMDDIFQPYDGKELKDASQWNKEYFLTGVDELRNNFSEVRFHHLCLVGAHISPRSNNQDTIIINNTEPVTDIEVQVEKLKAGVALGAGLVIGFLIGKSITRK